MNTFCYRTYRRIAGYIGCWLLGLAVGAFLAILTDRSYFPLMRAAISCRVSIIPASLIAILPFLITAFAVHYRVYAAVPAVAFFRAIGYAFCGVFILRCFGGGSWLLRPMVQFSATVSGFLLCRFELTGLFGDGVSPGKLAASITISVLAVIVDALLLAPFLAKLMQF